MNQIAATAGLIAAIAYMLAFICFAILIWHRYLR